MTRLPMYRKIADAIRAKISNGIYKVGEALPTEAQLREEFSVSRVTVRQAIKLLTENEELESIQGSGTYVKESKINYNIYQQSSFAEKWAHLEGVTHSDVLTFQIQSVSLTMAEQLDIKEGEQAFYVKRVRFLTILLLRLKRRGCQRSCFLISATKSCKVQSTPILSNKKALVIDRSEQEIVPVLAAEDVATLLGIAPEMPVIEKRTRGYLHDDTVFEYSRNYFHHQQLSDLRSLLNVKAGLAVI